MLLDARVSFGLEIKLIGGKFQEKNFGNYRCFLLITGSLEIVKKKLRLNFCRCKKPFLDSFYGFCWRGGAHLKKQLLYNFYNITYRISKISTKFQEISVFDIVFDIATKLKTIDVKTSRPTAVATNTQSGGSHIFVGNGNGTCSATSMTNHSSTIISEIKLQTSKSPILGMKCIAGQTKKIGLFQESEAFLYDFIGGKTVHTWKHHVAPLRAMEFSPVSPDLGFTASYDYHCKMFDLRTSEIVLSKRFDR